MNTLLDEEKGSLKREIETQGQSKQDKISSLDLENQLATFKLSGSLYLLYLNYQLIRYEWLSEYLLEGTRYGKLNYIPRSIAKRKTQYILNNSVFRDIRLGILLFLDVICYCIFKFLLQRKRRK